MTLAPSSKIEAIKLRAAGMSWTAIADQVGASLYAVRCELQEGYRAKRNAETRRHRIGMAPTRRIRRRVVKSNDEVHRVSVFEMPESVVIDQQRRATLSPRDMTAALFGDPLPGYSALDRTLGRKPLYERLKA